MTPFSLKIVTPDGLLFDGEAEEIDLSRAEASLQRADKVLHDKASSDTDLRLAEARLRRALVRKSVASNL